MAMSEFGIRRHQEEAARACATQTFALLPSLRRFVTSRVQFAGADLGLSLRQFAALRGIQEGASSPGDLARLWQVTPAVITGIVDRLESRGLVRRAPDPDDRRRLRLVLTETGRRASDEVEAALTDELAAPLAAASATELAELSRALSLLQRTFASLDQPSPGGVPLCPEEDMPVWDDEAKGGGSAPLRSVARRPGRKRTAAGWTGGRR